MADASGVQAGVVGAEGAVGMEGQADGGHGVQLDNAPAPALARGVFPQAPLPVASNSLLKEPLSQEQIKAAIADTDSELVYLWEQGKGLPVEVQARFSIMGFSELDVFSKLADSAAEVRVIASTELGLRDDLGIKGRALVGRILTCWEAAQKRMSRRQVEGADQ